MRVEHMQIEKARQLKCKTGVAGREGDRERQREREGMWETEKNTGSTETDDREATPRQLCAEKQQQQQLKLQQEGGGKEADTVALKARLASTVGEKQKRNARLKDFVQII